MPDSLFSFVEYISRGSNQRKFKIISPKPGTFLNAQPQSIFCYLYKMENHNTNLDTNKIKQEKRHQLYITDGFPMLVTTKMTFKGEPKERLNAQR